MNTTDFTDKKWCPSCDAERQYLSTPEHDYCTECSGRVRLFRQEPSAPTHWIRKMAAKEAK